MSFFIQTTYLFPYFYPLFIFDSVLCIFPFIFVLLISVSTTKKVLGSGIYTPEKTPKRRQTLLNLNFPCFSDLC